MNYANQSKRNQIKTLEQLNVHDHICSVYETKEEQFSVIVPFIKIGLERGEKCIYVVNDNTTHEVQVAMQTGGIDMDSALNSGSLSILNRQEYFTKQDSFKPDRMIQFLKETVDSAKAEGYKALRLTAEMTWFFGVDQGIEKLVEFESKINSLFSKNDIVAICQYNRSHFTPEIILSTIHTHPIVIYGSLVCKNFYYIHPDEYLKPEQTSLEIERLLNNIRTHEQKELELKENASKLRSILSSLYEASIVIYDREGKITELWGTPEMDKRYGLRAVDAVGRSIKEFLPSEHVEQRLAEIRRVFDTGEKILVEYITVLPNGTFWHETSLSPMRDASGNITAVVGFIRDVTKRKLADKRLRKLSQAVANSPATVIITDIEGNIVYTNNQFSRLTGYTCEETIGKNTRIFKSGKTPPEVYKKLWETITSGNEWRGEFYNRKKNGELYWESAQISPVKDDKSAITNFIAIKDDITEQRNVSQKMKRISEQLQASIEQMPTGYILWDNKFHVLEWNNAAELIFGYTKSEVLGTFAAEKIVPEDIRHQVGVVIENLQVGKVASYSEKNNNIRKDGKLLSCQWYNTPLTDENGKTIAIISIVEDITEKMEIEKTLLKSEKLKSLGMITAGVSHDFNNILAIISGKIQLLEMENKDNKHLTDELRSIMKAVDDGAEMSRKMLKSTITEKDTEGFIHFDIYELIYQAIDFTAPRWKNQALAKSTNYKINTEGMKQVPSILCNTSELREVFINIINNALDAMPEGGSILFSTWSGGDTVFASVSDTGEGMSEDTREKVFDPFFSTKGVSGTGLGMSMAFGIVSRHGGNIEVESEPGRGSTFILQFPVANKRKRLVETPVPEQETTIKNLRILVVDDEEALYNILDKFLSKDGHKVKTVDNGADAIELAKKEVFDLVLCDISMSDVSGYNVIKVLNKLERKPKIGIITGWGERLKLTEGEDMKVDFIMKKPFNLSELVNSINNLGIDDSAL